MAKPAPSHPARSATRAQEEAPDRGGLAERLGGKKKSEIKEIDVFLLPSSASLDLRVDYSLGREKKRREGGEGRSGGYLGSTALTNPSHDQNGENEERKEEIGRKARPFLPRTGREGEKQPSPNEVVAVDSPMKHVLRIGFGAQERQRGRFKVNKKA